MSQPYLFYSDQCANSKQIIETLKALNKTGLYKFILINRSTPREQIPSFLKAVPTLYIPETKDVIVGKDIYGFIAKPTNSRNEKATKDPGPQTSVAAATPGEYSAWGFEGMDRLSDSYSLWNAPNSFASEGGSMYTFLDGNATQNTGGAGMPTADAPKAENTIAKSKTGSNDDVLSRMEAMNNQRNKEFGTVDRK